MKPGGLLDRFPVHLFAGSCEGVVVILDDPRLGRLQIDAVPNQAGIVIAMSPQRETLQETRAATTTGSLCAVRADPLRPPFREGAVLGLVKLVGGDTRDGSPTLDAALAPDAWTVELVPPECWGERECEASCAAFVRPASGAIYFATPRWNPPRWPFRTLQLGKLATLRNALNRLAGRMPIPRLRDGMGVFIRGGGTKHAALARFIVTAPKSWGLFVKANWNALLVGCVGTIVKFPLAPVANSRMTDHAEHLDDLHTSGGEVFRRALPRLVESGCRDGQAYWAESWCDGYPATKYWWFPGWKRRAAQAGSRFLVDLHRETGVPTPIDRSTFDALVCPSVARIEALVREQEPAFGLDSLVEPLWQHLEGREIPLVRTHGDFWSGNVLVNDDAKLSGVLDWDASLARGWPVLDLLHFIAFQNKIRAYWRFGPTVTDRLLPRRLQGWLLRMADDYFAALSIDPRAWPAFVALYWLERSAQWVETDFREGKSDLGWLRRNVIEPPARIAAQLRDR